MIYFRGQLLGQHLYNVSNKEKITEIHFKSEQNYSIKFETEKEVH